MKESDLTYWHALATMEGVQRRRKNEIYVRCYNHEPRVSIVELFEDSSLWAELGMSAEEQSVFRLAREGLAGSSFVVEGLLSEGYLVVPMDSAAYPRVLKENMKLSTPTVLYAKGDMGLFCRETVAVVGSRRAGDVSLEFTRNVSRRAARLGEVVVSGYAKGVDREALESVLAAGGSSVIVLPQGIRTFSSGFKRHYGDIVGGRVVVVSEFVPQAGWSVGLAMARNATIYGLARRIYVAESDSKGGTWSGVVDGIRRRGRGREIYVRVPGAGERNANKELIGMGAVGVDMNGDEAGGSVSSSGGVVGPVQGVLDL